MPRKKSQVRKALTDSHLKAIGTVAASWSSLEMSILYIMAKIASIPFQTALILAGPSNLAAWSDMLKKLCGQATRYGWNEKKLSSLLEKIKKLSSERNNVVHASWSPETNNQQTGLLWIPPTNAQPPKIAKGLGVPKRGKSVLISVEKTAADIRDVAKKIEATEQELFVWLAQTPPRHVQLALALEAQGRQNPPTNPNRLSSLLSPSLGLGLLSPQLDLKK